MFQEHLPTLIIFAPTIGAVLLMLMPKDNEEGLRYTALTVTIVTFILTLVLLPGFDMSDDGMQYTYSAEWIPNWNINYQLGIDGISLPLILLTSFISLWAMVASWSITKQIKGYLILFLLLETGMLGVFMATDFFLFYVFWEVMLLPMYFLIGVWGGPRREYAAIKFFLYTLFGSVLMLIALLILYFNSDLVELAKHSDLTTGTEVNWKQLNIHEKVTQEVQESLANPNATPIHTFNIQAMAAMGQHTTLFSINVQVELFSS